MDEHAKPVDPDNEKSHEFGTKHNAVGFWSLPLDVFGEVPDVDYGIHRWNPSQVMDLTSSKAQMELGLFEFAAK